MHVVKCILRIARTSPGPENSRTKLHNVVAISSALKHQWLYLNTLDTLENLIAFYVEEHNTRLPHSAFIGQTPDEMYFGTGNDIPTELETARKSPRYSRMEVNRNMSCRTCEPLTSIAN